MAIYTADIYEPIDAVVTADTTVYTADNTTWPTADGGILVGALAASDATVEAGSAVLAEAAAAADFLDAEVIAAEVPIYGGGYYPRRLRPYPVVGVGFGILPELEGEAHGVVGVAGQSAAQVVVRAAAIGACGQVGSAAVVLKALAVASKGAVGTCGAGAGMIVKFSGTATGRHDDDEAAVIAFLLAA